MTATANQTPRLSPQNTFRPWDVRTDAQRLGDAQDDYLSSGTGEAAYHSMVEFTREGWKIGEEAFLTVDPEEWDGFIEAAADECRDGREAVSVITAAAYDELSRRVAQRDAYPFIADMGGAVMPSLFGVACAIVDPRQSFPETDGFERAMSALTYAAGELERHPPKTKAQHNRLSDQTLRISRVEVRSEIAITRLAREAEAELEEAA